MNISEKVKEEEWNSFLINNDEATVYHTPKWKEFLEVTFGYKTHYLFEEDDSGNIIGLLPLSFVKSKLTGNRLCSMPFSHLCGPLGSKDSLTDLLTEAIHLFKESNLSFLEIRSAIQDERFINVNSYANHTLDLSVGPDNLWQKLNRGTIRNPIKRAQKAGVIVEMSRDMSDLKDFYEINVMTKKNLGVPCHPWKFFKNMFNIFRNDVSLYVSKFNGEIIGGGVMIYFKNRVLYSYGAANPSYLNLSPYKVFTWKSIEDSFINGYSIYDFGRTHTSNTGLTEFKRRWGTVETPLYYNYYPVKSNSLSEKREGIKYRLASGMISKMPFFTYKGLSDVVFGHFG